MDTVGPDERAFLSAIAADPAADLPRLVYADWLDEHDRPLRAEFIRLQCEIETKARLPRREQDRHVGLWVRQQELLDEHSPEVLGPAGFLDGAEVQFHRGFAEQVDVHIDRFLSHVAGLATMLPLPRISVAKVGGRPGDFLSCPHLDIVYGVQVHDDTLIFDSGVLLHDDALPFDATGEFDWDAVLGGVDVRMTRLEVIDLEACQLGDLVVEQLGRARFPSLVDLDLSHNNITDAGVIALLNSGLPQRLRRMVLGGNPITDQGAIELADRLGNSPNLKHLNLRFTNIGLAGQQALLPRFGSRVDLF